ncbi:hypothetical protein Tco_1533596 [Tanacetum coccineum]
MARVSKFNGDVFKSESVHFEIHPDEYEVLLAFGYKKTKSLFNHLHPIHSSIVMVFRYHDEEEDEISLSIPYIASLNTKKVTEECLERDNQLQGKKEVPINVGLFKEYEELQAKKKKRMKEFPLLKAKFQELNENAKARFKQEKEVVAVS